MDIQFYGANCLVLSSKQVRVVIDDNLAALGGKSITKDGDIVLFTSGEHGPAKGEPKIVIDMPGEYEVSNVSVNGIQVRAHMDDDNQKSAIMYKIVWGETRLLVVGHAYPKLSESELEAIGIVDVMFVPVGGNGFTVDAGGAMQLIKDVEPKLVVPTHYADSSLKFEVPQTSLEDALKNISLEPRETVKKLTLKPADLTDTTQLVILEKS